MPTPLLDCAPIKPEVCVPCQLLLSAATPLPHSPAADQSPLSLASLSRPLLSPAVVALLMKS